MTFLSNLVISEPIPVGTSTIDHTKRYRLKLTCNEYVLLDHLMYLKNEKKSLDYARITTMIGFTYEQVQKAFESMVKKEIITDTFQPTIATCIEFEAEVKSDRFEEFWFDDVEKKKGTWPGSRPQAEKLFNRLLKEHSVEHLLERKAAYLRYLAWEKKERGFDRQRMMATVFLNNSTKRFEEDWDGYINKEEEKKDLPAQVSIGSTDFKNLMSETW